MARRIITLFLLAFFFNITWVFSQNPNVKYYCTEENYCKILLHLTEDQQHNLDQIDSVLHDQNFRNASVLIINSTCHRMKMLKLPSDIYKINWINEIIIDIPCKIEVTAEWSKFEKLYSIWIMGKLGHIEENIKFDSLIYLDLGDTRLKEIPTLIYNCQKLRSLYIGKGKIRVLPIDLKKLTMLRYFGLSNNKLRELPDWLCDLNLITLDIDRNRFKKFPNILCQCASLKVLDIYNNRSRIREFKESDFKCLRDRDVKIDYEFRSRSYVSVGWMEINGEKAYFAEPPY